MSEAVSFFQAHQTTISLVSAWLFSGWMSSMPPLPANAPYALVWIHNFGQFIAANKDKFATTRQPSTEGTAIIPKQ